MLSRRTILSGMIAAGLMPARGWADVGAPAFLAAARDSAGYALHGLTATGSSLFSVALPTRGHAAAAHPFRAEAVAFARRPGTYALVLDCLSGAVKARLTAPPGRHFYGHGAFSADGSLLFTTENDYDAARGRIGVWDVAGGYRRLSEFGSGGIGPHELRVMPDGTSLAIANGGIETHPDAGRAKLNIPFMRPNLTYTTLSGTVLEVVEPPQDARRNSMRHLTVDGAGRVALALQWQGDTAHSPALLMLHRRGAAPVWAMAPGPQHAAMQGYAGSVSFDASGGAVAITSPRGGRIQVFDAETGQFQHDLPLADVCGLAPDARPAQAAPAVPAVPDAVPSGTAAGGGFFASTGAGGLYRVADGAATRITAHDVAWDNHIVPVVSTARG